MAEGLEEGEGGRAGRQNEDGKREKLNTHMYVQNEKKWGALKKWSNLHWKISK